MKKYFLVTILILCLSSSESFSQDKHDSLYQDFSNRDWSYLSKKHNNNLKDKENTIVVEITKFTE
jgi:hypothetical protein